MKTNESPVMIDPVGGDTSALDDFGFTRLHASDLPEADEGKSYDPLRIGAGWVPGRICANLTHEGEP